MKSCSLPENVEIEILSRLPVKSLLRFKCVGKSWYTLIKNPVFIEKHLNRSSSSSSILLLRRHNVTEKYVASLLSRKTLDVSADVELRIEDFNNMGYGGIVSCCNGVLCLSDYSDSFFLLNPVTRELKSLPKPPNVPYPPHIKEYTRGVAFGFDPKTRDYKVARIVDLVYRLVGIPSMVQIYTLSSNSWREIDVLVPALVQSPSWFNTYINGVYNWFSFDEKGDVVVSFDLGDEVFRTTRLPELDDDIHHVQLAVLLFNGSLALIDFFPRRGTEKLLDVWLMDHRSSSWTKQFTVGPLVGIKKPLAILEDGQFLLESSEGELLSYDIHTRETKNLQLYGVPSTLQVSIYNESLVHFE